MGLFARDIILRFFRDDSKLQHNFGDVLKANDPNHPTIDDNDYDDENMIRNKSFLKEMHRNSSFLRQGTLKESPPIFKARGTFQI